MYMDCLGLKQIVILACTVTTFVFHLSTYPAYSRIFLYAVRVMHAVMQVVLLH